MITKCPLCYLDLLIKQNVRICNSKDHKFMSNNHDWAQITTRKLDIIWYSDKTLECYVAITSYQGPNFKGNGKLYELPWFEPNLSNIQLSIDKIQKLLVFT